MRNAEKQPQLSACQSQSKTRWQLQATTNGFPLQLSRDPNIEKGIIIPWKFKNSKFLGLLGKSGEVRGGVGKCRGRCGKVWESALGCR